MRTISSNILSATRRSRTAPIGLLFSWLAMLLMLSHTGWIIERGYAEEIAKVTKKLAKVEKYFKKGQDQNALALLEKLVKSYPKDARPSARLAQYYLQSHLFNDAITYAEQAYSIDPKQTQAKDVLCESYQGVGQMFIQQKNFTQAKAAYDKLMSICPSDDNKKRVVFLFSQMAAKAIQNRDYAAAIESYNKMIDLEPDNQKLYFELFKLYLKNNQEEKATTLLEDGIKRFPKEDKMVKALGAMYFRKGKYEQARDLFNRILETDQSNLFVATYLAYAEQSIAQKKFSELKENDQLPKVTKTPGKTKKSIAEYKKEVAQKKEELKKLKQELYAPVIEAFKRAMAMDTTHENPKLAMSLAVIQGFVGDTEGMSETYSLAAAIYEQKANENPDDLNAKFYSGFCLLNCGKDMAKAEQIFRSFMEADTENKHPTAAIYLAEILVEQKKWEEARTLLEKFKQDNPTHSAVARANQWLEWIEAALQGTPLASKPRKLQISEPVIELNQEDQQGLTLD